ncbi:MAG: hypothetical protein MH321_13135 [Leptospiraceae bacterium]|nr:hypothetical protein [Leptospiraceae bacterium]
MEKSSALIMFTLGLGMIFLGWKVQGLPPAITGLGFLVIAANYWKVRKD